MFSRAFLSKHFILYRRGKKSPLKDFSIYCCCIKSCQIGYDSWSLDDVVLAQVSLFGISVEVAAGVCNHGGG